MKLKFEGLVADESEEETIQCKGLYYRATSTAFISKRGELVSKVKLTPLKKLSCSGCADCGGTLEEIEQQIHYYLLEGFAPTEGAIYTPYWEASSNCGREAEPDAELVWRLHIPEIVTEKG